MSRVSRTQTRDRALVVMSGILIGVALVGIFYWAQSVLIPVALAIFFTFLLTPVVLTVQRWGIGRIPAVVAATVLAGGLVTAFAWLVVTQIGSLIGDLPSYTNTLKQKIEAVQSMGDSQVWKNLEKMVEELSSSYSAGKKAADAISDQVRPAPVVVEKGDPFWLRVGPQVFGSTLELLGQGGLVVVLVIFMLLSREDLRNRFIRLAGHGRMTVTTKAVDDASQRISRFLFMQLIINGTYGLALGVGLAVLGVHYALLWGFLAGTLRYIPYVGAPAAALFPIALSVVQFEAWWPVFAVVGWIVLLELISNNLMEPWLYGQSIGVSEVALLVSAAFWAFLWGPIGLVLSCPLTVCLVVLGKYVPCLEFMSILLGDEPALQEDQTFYQRLSAHDLDEATRIVQDHVEAHPAEQVYDSLLVPALMYATRDYQRGGLDDDDLQFVHESMDELLEELDETPDHQPEAGDQPGEEDKFTRMRSRVRILGVPVRDRNDGLALEMLKQLLEEREGILEIVSHEMLSSELLTKIAEEKPAAVCLGALPPNSLARTRYLCKRLRARFPRLKIVVGRWGSKSSVEDNRTTLEAAGADQVETRLLDTRDHLRAWLPAMAEKASAQEEKSRIRGTAIA